MLLNGPAQLLMGQHSMIVRPNSAAQLNMLMPRLLDLAVVETTALPNRATTAVSFMSVRTQLASRHAALVLIMQQ